jgi:hypothetical protein
LHGPHARWLASADPTLAGPEAEGRLTGRANSVSARLDHAFAADVALTFVQGHEEEATAYVRWLEHRTRRFVAELWPQIERVAALLLERKTITGTEIDVALPDDPDAALRKGKATF